MKISAFFNQKKFLPKKSFWQDIGLAIQHIYDLNKLYRTHSNNEVAYYNLLFSVAISAAPMTIVELGTGPGVSSLAFKRAIEYHNSLRSKKGIFHTCDLDARTLKSVQRWGKSVQAHLMSTDDFAVKWAEHATPIDILYIDADHSHLQSLADFEHFSPFVKPNGLVMMHDTHPLSVEHEQHQFSGTVYKTAQYIKKSYTDEFEIMTIPYLCGIGLLRKKGSKYF